MKATFDISDDLMNELRKRAASQRTTMRSVLEAALRQVFGRPRRRREQPFKLKDASVNGTGYAPGIRPGDWEQIRDIIYEGRGA